MKLIKYFQQLEAKLDIALEFIGAISEINARYVDKLPEEYKSRFILYGQRFFRDYKNITEVEDDKEDKEEN